MSRSGDEQAESDEAISNASISDEDDNASGSWLVDDKAETDMPGDF